MTEFAESLDMTDMGSLQPAAEHDMFRTYAERDRLANHQAVSRDSGGGRLAAGQGEFDTIRRQRLNLDIEDEPMNPATNRFAGWW